MWVLLSSRLRRWLLLTVAVPVLGAGARRLAARLEARHGPTKVSRALDRGGRLAARRRGRAAPR